MVRKSINEQAVSPVIGTILLVAITVVLIAIIAAVVMGLANLPAAKDVGMQVKPTLILMNESKDSYYAGISLTVYGGKDVPSLKYLNITLEGANLVLYTGTSETKYKHRNSSYATYIKDPIPASDIIGMSLFYYPTPIPGPIVVNADDYYMIYENTPIVITGTFKDGTQQVLYKGTITIPPPPVDHQNTGNSDRGKIMNPDNYQLSPILI